MTKTCDSSSTTTTDKVYISEDTIVSGAPHSITAALFDIDGTIVGPNHFISPRTIQAIAALRNRGVILGFATGRASFAAEHLSTELGITGPSMFFAGSLIKDLTSGKTLYRVEMSPSTLSSLIRLADASACHLELYTESDFFASRICEELTIHQQYSPKAARISPLSAVMNEEVVIKAVMMAREGAAERALRQMLSSIPDVAVTYSYGAAHKDIVFANIVDIRATRAAAFREFLRIHQCSAQSIATFGDSEADCAFLEMARFGVAPSNALASAKQSASFITTSVQEGGVGLAIEKLFLP